MTTAPGRGLQQARFVVLALALFAVQASAQDAKVWLDRMNQAVEQLNYEGTFVRVVDGAAETMHIVHRYNGDKVIERIRSLDGPDREIIRHGQQVQCVLPDRRLVLLESPSGPSSPISSTLPNYSEALEAHYEFRTFPRGHVAQRETQVVVIKGRDDYRYGYVLWLDQETAIPLKMQVRDELGNVIDEILFTEFELNDSIPDAALAASIDSTGFRHVGPAIFSAREKAAAAWNAAELPEGFSLSVARRIDEGDADEPLEHLVYSDGLATVSVFVASSSADVAAGPSRFGSTNAYTVSRAGHKITAMGDLPGDTLRRIAASVRRIDGEGR